MKKIAVCLMAAVLVLTMSVSVFAAGNFVSSPSVQDTPQLVDYVFVGDCEGELIVTPYSERDALDEDDKTLLEDAYQLIHDSEDLTELFDGIKIPDGKDGLGVSDLFFVDYDGCDEHDDHNPYTATIKPEIIDNVAGVYVFVNGQWIAVDYKVDGENLVLTSNYYGPYAIVVGTGDVPGTGDSFPWGYLVAMVVSAAGLAVIAVAFKKQAV